MSRLKQFFRRLFAPRLVWRTYNKYSIAHYQGVAFVVMPYEDGYTWAVQEAARWPLAKPLYASEFVYPTMQIARKIVNEWFFQTWSKQQ